MEANVIQTLGALSEAYSIKINSSLFRIQISIKTFITAACESSNRNTADINGSWVKLRESYF